MRSLQSQNPLLVPIIAVGVAVLALMWFLAIAPKRSESSDVGGQVAAQDARLSAAHQQAREFAVSRRRFPGLLAELRTMDVAVPARGEIANLLREVQRRARLRHSDLRLASLKNAAVVAPAAVPAPSGTPGATIGGPSGLSMLPFTFTYTGRYFDLLSVLRAVRQAVTVRSGDLSIGGRLLTIDGLSFERPDPSSPLTKATISATAYIADGPAPTAPAGSAATTPAKPKAAS